MSPVQETQSMREIRLLRGRLPHKGGGLTGMDTTCLVFSGLLPPIKVTTEILLKVALNNMLYMGLLMT
jgi:hypothetical protein